MEITYIDNVKVQFSQIIAALHKVKHPLNKSAPLLLYNSRIVPYLTYCIEVWGSACKTFINPVFPLQKQGIRDVSGSGYREPTNPIFIQFKTLTFNELVECNLLKTMYKAHQKLLPDNF